MFFMETRDELELTNYVKKVKISPNINAKGLSNRDRVAKSDRNAANKLTKIVLFSYVIIRF